MLYFPSTSSARYVDETEIAKWRKRASEPSLQNLPSLATVESCYKQQQQQRRASLFSENLLKTINNGSTLRQRQQQSKLLPTLEENKNQWPNAIVNQNDYWSSSSPAVVENDTPTQNCVEILRCDANMLENERRFSAAVLEVTAKSQEDHLTTFPSATAYIDLNIPSAEPDDEHHFQSYFLPRLPERFAVHRTLVEPKRQVFAENCWSWAGLIASAIVVMICVGTASSLGILFVFFEEYFRATQAQISVLYGMGGVAMLVASVSCLLIECNMLGKIRGGYGAMVIVGSLVAFGGFLAAAFAEHFWHLYFSLGILTFVGYGLCLGAALGNINHFVERSEFLAGAVVALAAGAGIVIFPPIFTLTINVYGWATSSLVNSGLTLLVFVCGVVFQLAWRRARQNFYKASILSSTVSALNDRRPKATTPRPKRGRRETGSNATNLFAFSNSTFVDDVPAWPVSCVQTGSGTTRREVARSAEQKVDSVCSAKAIDDNLSFPKAAIINKSAPGKTLTTSKNGGKKKRRPAKNKSQILTTIELKPLSTSNVSPYNSSSSLSDVSIVREMPRQSLFSSLIQLSKNLLSVFVLLYVFFASSTEVLLLYVVRLHESTIFLLSTGTDAAELAAYRQRASFLLTLFGFGIVCSSLAGIATNRLNARGFKNMPHFWPRYKVLQLSAILLAVMFCLLPEASSSFALLALCCLGAGIVQGLIAISWAGMLGELFGRETVAATWSVFLFFWGLSRCLLIPVSGTLIDCNPISSDFLPIGNSTTASMIVDSHEERHTVDYSSAFYFAGASQVLSWLALVAVDFRRGKICQWT